MVEKPSSKIDRRSVLKTSAASLAGIFTTTGSVIATRGKNSIGNSPVEANQAQFDKDKLRGFAKGTHNNPITPDTIMSIQRSLINNQPDERKQNNAILHDPTAEPADEYQSDNKTVLGYGIKWRNKSPCIYIKTSQNSMENEKKRIEDKSHRNVDEFMKDSYMEKA